VSIPADDLIRIQQSACSGKKPYASKKLAKLGAKQVKRLYSSDQKPYECLFCRNWHLGHRPKNPGMKLLNKNNMGAV
jgi:hypothetical protein